MKALSLSSDKQTLAESDKYMLIKKENTMKLKLTENNSLRRKKKAFITGFFLLFLTAPSIAGWEVQWIDKFDGVNEDGTGINWDNWTAQTEANYNNEVQCYTDDDTSDEKNYDVSDGTLKIIARKQNSTYICKGLNNTTSKTWTSGRLNSKDKSEFLYGRIESKIRFEANAGQLAAGTWPAFWMLENRINQQPVAGDDDSSYWPSAGAGEIDVWEWFSNEPDTYITNFFNNESCAGEYRYSYPNGGVDVQNWHTYAIEWAKDKIDFYIDETLVVSQDVNSCSQYEESMFVLLNVAMGGNLGGTIDSGLETATMEVDYVAHCYDTDNNTSEYCNEDTTSNENQSVTISMTQDNGIITLTTKTVNIDGDYTLRWDIDSLPNPAINNNKVTFDSSSMTSGDYTVSVQLTTDDNSISPLSDEYTFIVKTTGNNSNGGSLNYLLLLCLGLITLSRHYKIAK